MSTLDHTSTPREVDEALAALWHLRSKAQTTIDACHSSAHSYIGERARYVSRNVREWPTTDAEALATLRSGLAAVKGYYTEHATYIGAPGPVPSHSITSAEGTLVRLAEATARRTDLDGQIAELEELYAARPWSRFFLVTSSTGHVHASMYCSTCRWSTTYGWLPELSGKTEAEAVAELGAVLCSVCFPSAPVEHQGGKITKAQAAKLAA